VFDPEEHLHIFAFSVDFSPKKARQLLTQNTWRIKSTKHQIPNSK